MINYKKLIINIAIQKLFLLLSLVSCSISTAENLPSNRLSKSISPEQNLSSQASQLHASAISQTQITQMMRELQQLINRVESTLISVEAKESSTNSQMSAAVAKIFKNNPQATFTSTRISNNGYSNSRAYQAIANGKKLLEQFPILATQNYPQARRMWLDARRSLWDSYPVNKHLAQPEIRAMWLDRGTIVKAKSKKDLQPLFDRMATAGINTVFFETLNASYPIYPSGIAPEQNPLTKGWDPLKAAVELAHERDMELHAWLWVFAAANQGHNQILGQPKNYLGPVLSRNPSWVLKDQNGQVFNRTSGFKKAFFDPANPEVRRYLLSLMDEIVTKYDVDGIQLDYIRYPFQDGTTKQQFGYTNVSRNLFKQNYGVDPKTIKRSSALWQAWTGFRVQQVNSFVTQSSQRIKSKRPDLILSTAVFPMERRRRLATLQQNWEDWSYDQSVDMVVLMTYALDTGNFEDRIKPINQLAGKNSSFIIPGIRLLNIPDTEAFDQMQLIRNMPSGGYALFAAENFNNSLEAIFQKTQGNTADIEEPIPYRQPFVSVVSRYQALQQEWIFLLQNKQIEIDPAYLQQWSEQSDRLALSLKELAENPSVVSAVKAQKNISSFRLRLSRYLTQHQQTNSWQVQTWMNRLITLENMLQYGQKTILVQQKLNSNTSALQTSKE